MKETILRVCTVENLQTLLLRFKDLGILAPILLTMLESVFPPLPLIGIVALNVLSHGAFKGALLSWIGTCVGCTLMYLFYRWLFRVFRGHAKKHHERLERARDWVRRLNVVTLFAIAMLPFTPSAFLNFAFGASDYPAVRYLPTIYLAKLLMIIMMAVFGKSLEKAMDDPLYIIFSIAFVAVLYLVSQFVSRRYHLGKDRQPQKISRPRPPIRGSSPASSEHRPPRWRSR
ncbi:MAG: TVP38/TMEM64 family protein [Clostridia bacterium]|nr:TVP38/TMEM64 family protein [Clostridia bacterium]